MNGAALFEGLDVGDINQIARALASLARSVDCGQFSGPDPLCDLVRTDTPFPGQLWRSAFSLFAYESFSLFACELHEKTSLNLC